MSCKYETSLYPDYRPDGSTRWGTSVRVEEINYKPGHIEVASDHNSHGYRPAKVAPDDRAPLARAIAGDDYAVVSKKDLIALLIPNHPDHDYAVVRASSSI